MTLDALSQLSNKYTPRIDQLVEGKKNKNLIKFRCGLLLLF